ncbi:Serine hydrolase-like protein [Habropoda laboriosa]|uniref:Serine hydrolase-like protein n=1 Tax=Habropoda laboriosa TaxID=597456 RepID=A0A0L7RKB9_9HYME|nr:PREDICTED: serine hydrolase-like protein 2 [Habropoda laboriosa]KOC71258.1 Serine hydrolase-like protein [Habropoda laboriosa]
MNQAHQEPTEMKFPVPWGHIAAKSYGSSKEKKILVVHGILDNAGSFDRLIKLLPEEYHYVCIDLPGHGLSSFLPSGGIVHFFDYVHSILLVLNALKWKTCIYIGHSFGAQLGTYFSILYPGRLEKMIAIDSVINPGIEGLALVPYIRKVYSLYSSTERSETLYSEDEIMQALKFKRKEVLRTEAAQALFKRAVTKVGDLYKYNRDSRLRHIPKPILTIKQQIDIFSQFSTPILVIIADNTHRINLLKGELNAILSAADKSKFSVVTVKGNHDVHNNFPERVAPYIWKFLNNTLQSKL